MRVVALLCALVSAGLPVCLPDGIPENERRNLTYDGYNGPIVDTNAAWPSGQIISGLARILLTEVLGYTYDKFGSPSWTTAVNVQGPSGCKGNIIPVGACDDYDEWAPQVHMGLEGWATAHKAAALIPSDRRATELAKHAYRGREAIFFTKKVEDAAFYGDKLVLSTYKGWNATSFPQLQNHFDTLESALPKLEAAGVTLSTLASTPSAVSHANYVAATGDDGDSCYFALTDTLTSDPAESCNGEFWVSPACRANPKNCIPVITSSGWGEAEFRQWAAFYDMPLAILDTTWGGYTSAPRAADVPFYWWYPDATFADLEAQQLLVPAWNINEHSVGVYKTAMPETQLARHVWRYMEQADKSRGEKIVYILNRIAVYDSDIDMWMARAAQGEDSDALACEFVLQNEQRWKGWIPDMRQCIIGEGWSEDLGACVVCEAGFVSTLDMAVANYRTCQPCQAGTYCAPGSTLAVSCDPGHYCPDAQMDRPLPCASGHEQPDEGALGCHECAVGTFAEERGQPTCHPCPAGHFGDSPGMSECKRCLVRKYQDELGKTECKVCKPLFTSPPGAIGDSDCMCDQDFFYSEAEDKCFECPLGAICLPGRGVPLVKQGFYGEPVTAVATGKYELDNGGVWQYVEASSDAPVFKTLEVWQCPFGVRSCPGATIETEAGFVAHDARYVEVCEGDLMQINGCSRCLDGLFFSLDAAQCVPCTGGDDALYPCFFVLGLSIMYSLYRATAYSGSQKLTNMLMFSCSASLLVNFFQMLGVIGFFSADFPDLLGKFFEFFKLFVFDMELLKASCAMGSDFAARFMTRVVSPLIFVLTFLALYPLSVVLKKATVGKVKALDSLNLLNTAGLVSNAGYISLCKVSMQFFECKHQPAAPATVAAYPDVDCQSAEHNSMFGLAVLMTMLYGAGIYLTSVYLCWVAPKRMLQSRDFRRTTRFLVGRWNPGRWYWGPVLQTRNLLVSLVAVAYPSDGTMQFLTTGGLVVIYTCAQSTMEPWRDNFLNVTDSVLGMAISLTCMFGSLLVSDMGKESAVNRRGYAEVYLTFIFASAFLALTWALGRSLLAFARPKKQQARDNMYTKQATKLLLLQTTMLYKLHSDGATTEEIEDAVGSFLTQSEQKQVFKISGVILHELCGVNVRAGVTFKRLMLNKIEGDALPLNDIDVDLADNVKSTLPSRVSVLSRVGGTQA